MQNISFFLLLLTEGAPGVGDPDHNDKGEGLHAVSDAELHLYRTSQHLVNGDRMLWQDRMCECMSQPSDTTAGEG